MGGDARIEVRDSGPGMPAEQARRVFERFFRADPARARTSGGSGLGLSIVAAIVAAHGGTVSASSAPAQGMTVTVLLPMAGSDEHPEPEHTQPDNIALAASDQSQPPESASGSAISEVLDGVLDDTSAPTPRNGSAIADAGERPLTNGAAVAPAVEPHAYPATPPDAAT